jgi:hypothetical protein
MCVSDLVRVSAGVVVPEVSLSALEVVVGALPVRAPLPVDRGRPECVARVGDGVVEAVGLDARGGLLPSAASARVVRQSAQRRREVGSWSLERDAEMFAATTRELRVELGDALPEDAAFGLPLGAVRDTAREVALTLGGGGDFLLGELEALALQRTFGGVRGPAAQHTARGLIQLGDACPRRVSDALGLGLGAAGGAHLLGEVLGVAADALTNLREFGL